MAPAAEAAAAPLNLAPVRRGRRYGPIRGGYPATRQGYPTAPPPCPSRAVEEALPETGRRRTRNRENLILTADTPAVDE